MRRGFTLLELLTVVAALVIVFGLMVSLARHVRGSSAVALTSRLLADLDAALRDYQSGHPGSVNALPLLTDDQDQADEAVLQLRALENNRAWVKALLRELRQQSTEDDLPLAQLPVWLYDERSLRDPWGTPVVLMPRGHPLLGMSAGDRAFFLSAGPDRCFLTREDNLYSYESRGLNEVLR
jgi:prepilin-type N-terminal cleavage/methylation domain-containing protein